MSPDEPATPSREPTASAHQPATPPQETPASPREPVLPGHEPVGRSRETAVSAQEPTVRPQAGAARDDAPVTPPVECRAAPRAEAASDSNPTTPPMETAVTSSTQATASEYSDPAPPPDDVLVTCRDAALTFGRGANAVVAVHGAHLRVRAGDRLAIIGPSGSGKSSLLHLLAGLEQPTSGTVTWPALAGPQHTGPDTKPDIEPGIRRDIGLVFQGDSLIPALDVVENTALPLVLAGVPDADARKAALAALALVGADDLAERLPEEISGGQAQRVAAARVLAQAPRLILADEPTGRLDHTTGGHVLDALLTAADETGAALVVTTHDPAVAARLSTRLTMRDGRLLTADHSGAPQDTTEEAS